MKWLGISAIGCMIIFSCAGQQPENLGVHDGRRWTVHPNPTVSAAKLPVEDRH